MTGEVSGPIFVTGASGHTGKYLITHLASSGVEVRALTRYPVSIPVELRRKVVIVRAGLEDEARVVQSMQGCEAVVAMTHIKFAAPLIELMKQAGVKRGVFLSSTRRFTKFPEETAHQVITGEALVEASGLDYTILRPSMIYGGREDNNLEHVMRSLTKNPIFPLVGGGRMLWQPVFTLDVVKAIDSTLRRDEAVGKSLTLAGPEPISYREMVETIAHAVKRKPVFVPVPIVMASAVIGAIEKFSRAPRVKLDQVRRLQEDKVFDISPARSLLQWEPRPFEEGIRMKVQGEV